VVAREDVPGEKRLVAYFTLRGENRPGCRGAARSPESGTAGVHGAECLCDARGLPQTPSAADRRALPAPDWGVRQSTIRGSARGGGAALAGIWQQLLRVNRVGRHDNFFELGGHSLPGDPSDHAYQSHLDIDLPLRAVFEEPTIEALGHWYYGK